MLFRGEGEKNQRKSSPSSHSHLDSFPAEMQSQLHFRWDSRNTWNTPFSHLLPAVQHHGLQFSTAIWQNTLGLASYHSGTQKKLHCRHTTLHGLSQHLGSSTAVSSTQIIVSAELSQLSAVYAADTLTMTPFKLKQELGQTLTLMQNNSEHNFLYFVLSSAPPILLWSTQH